MSRTFDILGNDTVEVLFDNLGFQALLPALPNLCGHCCSFTLMYRVCALQELVLCRTTLGVAVKLGRGYDRYSSVITPSNFTHTVMMFLRKAQTFDRVSVRPC